MVRFNFGITIVLSVLTINQSQANDYCLANDTNPRIYFGPITAYEFVHGNLTIINDKILGECTPLQFWSANRHGTRLPTVVEIIEMKHLGIYLQRKIIENYQEKHSNPENGSLCSTDLENLKAWKWDDNITVSHNLWLTTQGFLDLENIASRYKTAFPSLLDESYNLQNYHWWICSKTYLFETGVNRQILETVFRDKTVDDDNKKLIRVPKDSKDPSTYFIIHGLGPKFYYSDVQRLLESMEGYMTGLFGQTEDPSGQTDNNTYVGPYDSCLEYQINNIKVELPNSEKSKFTRTPQYKQMVEEISRRLGFSKYKLTQIDIETMYNLCRYEKAWNPHELSPWCAAFTPDQLPILEYEYDLDGYYKTGYGYKHSANFGCLYIGYLLDSFQRVANNSEDQPKAVAYFTHAEMVQMFMVALGVEKDPYTLKADNYDEAENRKWKISLISPFATNLVSVFYNCSDGSQKLQFFLNENRLEIDGCENGVCDWNYFYNTFKSKADNCHQRFCL